MGGKFESWDGEPDHKAKRRRRRFEQLNRRQRRPQLAAPQTKEPCSFAFDIQGIDPEALLEQCQTEYATRLVRKLVEFKIAPNLKRFDQHFLVDPGAIEAVVDTGGIQSHDSLLEIGPGPGNLTEAIWEKCVETGAQLATVELDLRFQAMLELFPEELVRYWGDAIKEFDSIAKQRKVTKVIANIPYRILEPLLVALHTHRRIQSAVLIVGKNYAKRVCASIRDPHSEFTVTSLFSQARFAPRVIQEVPRESSLPEPRTASAIVALDSRKSGEANPLFSLFARSIAQNPNLPTRQLVQDMISIRGPRHLRGAKLEEMANQIHRVEDLNLSREVLACPVSQLANHELRLVLSRLDLHRKKRRFKQ